MRRASTWELLGIAPTADQVAIRSAYARKRDALDAERDPALAIALREAFESARFAAQWLKPEDVPDLPVEAAPVDPPARPADPVTEVVSPAEPPQVTAPPPVVETGPAPQGAEPQIEPVPDQGHRAPQQVTVVQPPRRSSPWRPRRPASRAAAPRVAEPLRTAIDAPSFGRRLPKGLRLLPLLMAGAAVYAIFHAFGAFTPSPAPSLPEPERSAGRAPVATAPEPVGELSSWVADIDRTLEEKFAAALDIRRIETGNPALLAKLRLLWERSARSGATAQQLAQEVGALTDRWYTDGLSGADVALATEHSRLTTDMAIALREKSLAQCSRFLEGDRRWDPALGLDETLRARELDLMARVLLETDGEAREAPPATIPASVVQTAAQRAGTTPEAIHASLTRKDRAPADCSIAIAVTEAVLELPDTIRLPILRVL